MNRVHSPPLIWHLELVICLLISLLAGPWLSPAPANAQSPRPAPSRERALLQR